MTCRELIELLDAYRNREVSPEVLAACEEHLRLCPSCVAYLDSYEKTIALGRAAFADLDAPVPAEVPEDLVRALLELRRG